MQPSAYVRATPSLLGEQVLYAVPVRTHHARAALSISYSN
jgi:hypothetical protein